MEPQSTKQQKDQSIKSFNFQEVQTWKQELIQKGVVVIKNIISEEQVQKAISLFWDWLEALGIGIKRGDPQTWEQWPGMRQIGFFGTYGGAHTQASWFLRSHPRVRSAFSKIWETEQLISSFDIMIGWRPWWMNKTWAPCVQNLHVDQNPHFKRGLKCVQGMIPLKRVRDNQVGGLMVVPNTNNDESQNQLIQRYPGTKSFKSDWVQLKDSDPLIKNKKGVLVQCNAGDLILWDSRTVHGGKICEPSEEFKQQNKTDFVRLSMTVTMVPRSLASKQVLLQRKKAFNDKIALTHWPNQFNKSGMGAFLPNLTTGEINYEWVKLTPQVESLI